MTKTQESDKLANTDEVRLLKAKRLALGRRPFRQQMILRW
jgi:hypothetical protein